tara:strand:+ start:164 stop:496 length:333 start_codon:yes stop_codon:yes gene_type:complete
MRYKKGDIVLVQSAAGDAIPRFHVRLLKRVVVAAFKGKSIDWPGYAGWEATPVFAEEVDFLRKEWSIQFQNAEKDVTFIYDRCIIKKPRNPKPAFSQKRRPVVKNTRNKK